MQEAKKTEQSEQALRAAVNAKLEKQQPKIDKEVREKINTLQQANNLLCNNLDALKFKNVPEWLINTLLSLIELPLGSCRILREQRKIWENAVAAKLIKKLSNQLAKMDWREKKEWEKEKNENIEVAKRDLIKQASILNDLLEKKVKAAKFVTCYIVYKLHSNDHTDESSANFRFAELLDYMFTKCGVVQESGKSSPGTVDDEPNLSVIQRIAKIGQLEEQKKQLENSVDRLENEIGKLNSEREVQQNPNLEDEKYKGLLKQQQAIGTSLDKLDEKILEQYDHICKRMMNVITDPNMRYLIEDFYKEEQAIIEAIKIIPAINIVTANPNIPVASTVSPSSMSSSPSTTSSQSTPSSSPSPRSGSSKEEESGPKP